jgi:hypothetical protein
MSRRGRHGRHAHSGQAPRPRPGGPVHERPATAAEAPAPARAEDRGPRPEAASRPESQAPRQEPVVTHQDAASPSGPEPWARPEPVATAVAVPPQLNLHAPVPGPGIAPAERPQPLPNAPRPAPFASAGPREHDGPRPPTCTVAQLRRFIKSRPWIPLHELRRRFGIDGGDDDVSPIRVGDHTLFIGLPPAESRLMAELLAGGDVGYELSLDPGAPIVVGVYPMRPVPRG